MLWTKIFALVCLVCFGSAKGGVFNEFRQPHTRKMASVPLEEILRRLEQIEQIFGAHINARELQMEGQPEEFPDERYDEYLSAFQPGSEERMDVLKEKRNGFENLQNRLKSRYKVKWDPKRSGLSFARL